jgi:hypothetical protein
MHWRCGSGPPSSCGGRRNPRWPAGSAQTTRNPRWPAGSAQTTRSTVARCPPGGLGYTQGHPDEPQALRSVRSSSRRDNPGCESPPLCHTSRSCLVLEDAHAPSADSRGKGITHTVVIIGAGWADRVGLAAAGRRHACLRARCRSRAIFMMRCGRRSSRKRCQPVPSIATPRPRSPAEVLGGVTAGAAVLSYEVQVILDEGV